MYKWLILYVPFIYIRLLFGILLYYLFIVKKIIFFFYSTFGFLSCEQKGQHKRAESEPLQSESNTKEQSCSLYTLFMYKVKVIRALGFSS